MGTHQCQCLACPLSVLTHIHEYGDVFYSYVSF